MRGGEAARCERADGISPLKGLGFQGLGNATAAFTSIATALACCCHNSPALCGHASWTLLLTHACIHPPLTILSCTLRHFKSCLVKCLSLDFCLNDSRIMHFFIPRTSCFISLPNALFSVCVNKLLYCWFLSYMMSHQGGLLEHWLIREKMNKKKYFPYVFSLVQYIHKTCLNI